ncbi:hypothetical protein [Neolewinella litorea]|uniref:Uncharacterized protein n=1 Tax=Neolewinella litorea TaxID=2562452 RepID=A0A4S4NLA6_9BACT|nr:hypothetical protein [Neolewinella litorea]THH40686.1 hypothetical protein E4021_08125 [Neolewinella litorea]
MSIQIGRETLVLLLGVGLDEHHNHFSYMTQAELEILGLEVQTGRKADRVAEFIGRRLDHHPGLGFEIDIDPIYTAKG